MKYVITENRLKDVVSKYLDSIDWRVLESSDELYPFEVYEHANDKGPTFVVRANTHKYGVTNVLLILVSFQNKLEDMFGESTVGEGPDDKPNTLVMNWFNKHFDIQVEDYSFLNNNYFNN